MAVEIQAVSMEDICGEAVAAARKVLVGHGIERPSVVVNFAWKEPASPFPTGSPDGTYAIGSTVPRAYRKLMADSLRQSAEEADA